MSPRMVPPGYNTLFPWLSEQDQATQANYVAEFQDLYSRGMDRALGLQESTLDCAVDLQSQAINFYKTAPWYTPLVGDCFEAGTRFLVYCLELQMKCLDLLLPARTVSASAPIPSGSAVGTTSRAEQAVRELAMDIGSGMTKKSPSPGASTKVRTTASC